MKHRITRYLLAAVMAVAACTLTSCDEEVIIEDYDPVITFTPSAIKFTDGQAVDFPYENRNIPHKYIHIEAPDWVEFSSSYNTGFMSAEEWNQNSYNGKEYIYHSYMYPRAIRCTADTPGLSGTVKVTWIYPLIDGKELRWYGEFTVEC